MRRRRHHHQGDRPLHSRPATPGIPEAAGDPLRPLLVAQFFGAFNDNAWKLMVALLAMRSVGPLVAADPVALEAASQWRTTVSFVVFTLPLMLFSLPAGMLADRLSKRSVILAMKGLEIALMGAGTYLLYLDPGSWTGPLVILGLMGAQSALFSPAKYGILPEIVPHQMLSASNGRLEMWTFLAIIAGTTAGGLLLDLTGRAVWTAGLILTIFSVAGLLVARGVPRVAPARASGGLRQTLELGWTAIRGQRILWLAVLGSTLFWAVASLLGQDILVHAKAFLSLSDFRASSLLAVFGLGVGGGGLIAGRLSGARVETGLIPLGALGLSLFTLLLVAAPPVYLLTLGLMVLLGVASGFLVVPLNSIMQWRAPAEARGAVIAMANVFIFGGILLGSLAVQGLAAAGLSTRQILLGGALITMAGTLWALWLLPMALLRLILVTLTHTVYRLRILHADRVPEKGGALLVPNHVSFVDGLFLFASLDRPVRFIVDAEYFHQPLLRPFMRAMQAIPISAAGGPRMILRAFRDAGRHLDEGHLVCIFAEGQITRTGMLLPFRRGLERIVRGRQTPIIPVHLDRVWGSIFSRSGQRFLTKMPRQIPYPVTVSFGEALAPGVAVWQIRSAVSELGAAAWAHRKEDRRPLHHTFVRTARRHPLGLAFADAARPRLRRFQALTGSIALARHLAPAWKDQTHVGILLPPSVPGALVNLAAALGGKVSVNLNYTAGRRGMESAVRQAGVRTIVTSREFIHRAQIDLPVDVETIWMEDVGAALGRGERLKTLAMALLAPTRLLERLCGSDRASSMDDAVTVIFSSGSTGDPKGVVLSHFNIDANVEGATQVFRFTADDRVLGILPLFHSFGYLLLWFAANHRMGLICHPNPLDSAAVGELVQHYRITFLMATPTFLQLYMRRCTPAQFGSLQVVLTGAEKLPERLALAFEDQFGIRPLEGYGTTECAPAIAVSAQDYRAPGFYQPGSRRGFVGQPLPGVAVRVVDPDTFAPLQPGTPGLLLVAGPNVMKGYLGRDDLTATVMRGDWYVTGDIALMDEDGFIRITDRLSRFSKIGGEMVPHGRVEEALHEAAGLDHQVFAVTAVADERKGERLAVLHTLDEDELPHIRDKLLRSGLPNLFVPRLDSFIKVDSLPMLGTGKLDLRRLRRLATEHLQAPPATL